MKWKRQQPEVPDGQADYWFNGRCVATAGLMAEIPENEVKAIAKDVHETAFKSKGIDYLQTYKHEDSGTVIWVIDQVTKGALERKEHPPEHNYFTILFPHEY